MENGLNPGTVKTALTLILRPINSLILTAALIGMAGANFCVCGFREC